MDSMTSFVAYKLPNQAPIIATGTWTKSDKLTQNGFLISDAHGERFWTFHPKDNCEIDAIELGALIESTVSFISESDYLNRASQLIQEMKLSGVDKVVYSRVKSFLFEKNNFPTAFNQLFAAYPNNLTYCLYHPELGFWMGSTPEILIRGEQQQFESMALAGTLPSEVSDDFWTQKEIDEQQYVADYLEKLIVTYGKINRKSERYVVNAGPVKHLRNDFQFELSPDKFCEFVANFHPTPAVCGVPKEQARTMYRKFEAHERSLYTGIIGIATPEKAALYVNLRCMQLFENCAALYVGGGFTQDSDPEKEWLETERKSETLTRVLKGK